jgi:hypothetical protein
MIIVLAKMILLLRLAKDLGSQGSQMEKNMQNEDEEKLPQKVFDKNTDN